MPENKEVCGPLTTLVEIKTTPEIEKAIAEQIRRLPEAVIRQPDLKAVSVFGLIACCIG